MWSFPYGPQKRPTGIGLLGPAGKIILIVAFLGLIVALFWLGSQAISTF